ncbi:uncharacterized protein [Haliotis asinina]|uniref:uncharacterized protein n=1 Tax=Haliotis asinina TaxID=109174 RepID=UPI0035326FEE
MTHAQTLDLGLPGVDLPNIALNKPTKQSSDYGPSMTSDRAVDGNHNPYTTVKGCAHVAVYNKPSLDWWQVDLQQTFLILTVSITNRGCNDRLTNFSVEVHTSDQTISNNSGLQLCYWHKDTVGKGLTVDLPCAVNTTGRYVRIVKYSPGNRPLALCEVEVRGTLLHKTCGDDRLTNFTVEVHTSDPMTSNNSGIQLCYWHKGTVGRGLTVDLPCAVNTTGRYVRIVKYSSGNKPLMLCEVDVRGTLLHKACGDDRLTNFSVEVHTSDPTISNNSGLQLCYWHEGKVGGSLTVDLPCAVNTTGRYVRIVKYSSGNKPLTLCEVEVRGTLWHKTCGGRNASRTNGSGHVAVGKTEEEMKIKMKKHEDQGSLKNLWTKLEC